MGRPQTHWREGKHHGERAPKSINLSKRLVIFCSFAEPHKRCTVFLFMNNRLTFDRVNQHHKIGLFSIGCQAYWDQFSCLRTRLEGYNTTICGKLQSLGAEVVNLGLIDSPSKAVAAGHVFRQEDVDLIFLHVSTYSLSSTVLPVVRRSKVPVIVLNLSPEAAIDYARFNRMGDRAAMTGEWLAHCQACCVPEVSNVFQRSGIRFHQVTGMLRDESAWTEISAWVRASHVAHAMEHNRLGIMGHYYGGMLDIYSDLTLQSSVFGTHIEMIEVDELSRLRRAVAEAETKARVAEIYEAFDVDADCSQCELERAARTSLALNQLVKQHGLGSLAYYYMGTGVDENEDTMSSIIVGTSMLTAHGTPVAGELEVKNAQAMKIMDLFGFGGSFTEYYATDFSDDIILMGHDGPGHIAIAEGKPRIRPLRVYHGKVGRGLSIEMSVKHGPVTLLAVSENGDGGLKLVVAEGESAPGPILEIGNTNSRYRFSIGARGFIDKWNDQGTAHHCAIGVGHRSTELRKLASLIGLECVQIC
jgi:L-arabinose isomerase